MKLSEHNVCLTMDIEPDYGRCATTHILDAAGPFFDWIAAESLPLTTFVTGRLIEAGHPIVDRLLAAGASVELHGYTHQASKFGSALTSHADEINRGTDAYVKRFGHVPAGYRAPAGVISAEDLRLLSSLGYRYDSSVFPVQRRGRYDFSRLPRQPFLWQELGLREFPIGLLTPQLPSGLTFINLLGPLLSAKLILRTVKNKSGPHIIDGHFHNLFSHPGARSTLPWAMRSLYTLGTWTGGLTGLRALTQRLRGKGVVFANLQDQALQRDTRNFASVPLKSLEGKMGSRHD